MIIYVLKGDGIKEIVEKMVIIPIIIREILELEITSM